MSTNPTGTVTESLAAETCVICGRDPGNTAFCHLYREGRRIVLCSPQCAEVFLERDSATTNDYDETANVAHAFAAPAATFAPPRDGP